MILRRLGVVRFFALTALLMITAPQSFAQQRPPIAEKMAKTFGLNSFGGSRGYPLHL